MPRPSILNRIATDLLLAGDEYRVAYEAAFRYDGAAAAAAARVPAHYMATETDVLLPHLDRLPDLPANARIHRLTDAERVAAVPATCWPPAPTGCRRRHPRRRRRARGASFRWTAHRSWCASGARMAGGRCCSWPTCRDRRRGSSPSPPIWRRSAGSSPSIRRATASRPLPRRARPTAESASWPVRWRRWDSGRSTSPASTAAPAGPRTWRHGSGADCGRLVLIDPAARPAGAGGMPAGNRARAHLERQPPAHRLASRARIPALPALVRAHGRNPDAGRESGSTWTCCTGASSIRSSPARPSPRRSVPSAKSRGRPCSHRWRDKVAVVTGEGMPDAAEQAALAADPPRPR